MEVYVIVMHSLSFFGFCILFVSLYLLFTVPTKMSTFSRFVMHGYELSSAISQLYMTLGTVPVFILPCIAGYPNGLLLRFDVMSTVEQTWASFMLLSLAASFSLLQSINRAFAVSPKAKKWKKLVVIVFLVQSLCQLILIAGGGINLEDGGKEMKEKCIQSLPYDYPGEMYSHRGVHYSFTGSVASQMLLIYFITLVVYYLVVSTICGLVLVRSVRTLGEWSQSARFLIVQRRITVGVIHAMISELVGLGLPAFCLGVCSLFYIGSSVISQYAMISMSTYPIFASYCVLMSNKEYRDRIRSILRDARKLSVSGRVTNTELVSNLPIQCPRQNVGALGANLPIAAIDVYQQNTQ